MRFFDHGGFLEIKSGTERLARPAQDNTRFCGSALVLSSASANSLISSIVRALAVRAGSG